MPTERKFRVFISYSHEDTEHVEAIVKVLEKIAWPMRDKDFRYEWGFHDQIKTYIAHAHIFLPVITEESSQRGWVHQEIGYYTIYTRHAPTVQSKQDLFDQEYESARKAKKWSPNHTRDYAVAELTALVAELEKQLKFQVLSEPEKEVLNYADEARKNPPSPDGCRMAESHSSA